MGTGYVRNDTSNNIADGNIINAADLDGEFDAIESAMGTSGHTHDGTSAEGGPVTVLGPVQDFVASATEIKPKTTNTLDIGTSGLLFKDMFLDGVATMGSIKIDNAGTIGTTTTGDAITISSSGIVTFKDDIIVKDGGTIGVTSAVDAMTVSSAGIVTFKDDIIIKDGGTIGSASDADAIAISSGGVVTFSQAVSNLGNVTGKTSSGFVLALQTSDISIEATNVLGKIEFSAPNEDSGTDAILVGASIEALAEDTFSSSVNSTALVFKTNTTGAATERMRLTSAGDLHFLDNRKAIFGGVTSELQIYSDGSHSYVSDQGTGNLRILAENFQVRNPANNEAMIIAIPDSGVTLYHDNSTKLATTSTGVDITGTLTSDGLTVNTTSAVTASFSRDGTDGDAVQIFNGAVGTTKALGLGVDGTHGTINSQYGGVKIQPAGTTSAFFGTGNDISFYEDTGTTAKLTWSASTESLRFDSATLQAINGTDPFLSGNAYWDGSNWKYATSTDATNYYQLGREHIWRSAASGTAGNNITWSNQMVIDSSGRVGIGTDSPTRALHVNSGASNEVARFESTDTEALIELVDTTGSAQIRSRNDLRFYTNGGSTRAMDITSSGNVGIGTSSPIFNTGSGIEIERAGEATLRLQDTANAANGEVRSGDAGLTFYAGAYGTSGAPFIWDRGGSEAMRIDSSGNVGIGTDSPVSYQTGPVLNIGDTSDSYTQLNFTTATNGIQYIGFGDATTGAGRYQGLIQFNHANNSMGFGTNASTTSALLIDSSGNVLVGKTSTDITADGIEARNSGLFSATRNGNTVAYINRRTSDGDIVALQKDGTTVGSIGTANTSFGTNPYIAGSGGRGLSFDVDVNRIFPCSSTGARADGSADLGASTARFKDLYLSGGVVGNSNSITISTDGGTTDHVTVDTSGNLLVGKTNTTNLLTTAGHAFYGNGEAFLTRAGTPLFLGRTGSDGSISNFYKDGVSVGSISVTSSATAYNTSSDYRLKTDAQPMTGATDRIKQLNPVNFEWIVDGTRVDGFLAHEAQAVVPEAVTGVKDAVDADGNPDYQGIDQSKLVPLLVATIKELEARITALENA